jgi:hypothetical protein
VLIVRDATPSSLDAADVELDVAAQFEADHGVAVEMDCPDDMPVASGEVYPCAGTTPDGKAVYVEIQIADPEEDVDYHWWTSFPD